MLAVVGAVVAHIAPDLFTHLIYFFFFSFGNIYYNYTVSIGTFLLEINYFSMLMNRPTFEWTKNK